MDASAVLAKLRALTLVVDGSGTIGFSSGDFGGILGHLPDAIVGRNVLDFVVERERDDVAGCFFDAFNEQHVLAVLGPDADLGDSPFLASTLPSSFRVTVVSASGHEVPTDLTITGAHDDPQINGWVVLIVPLELQTASHRPLEAFMAGADIERVHQLLAEDLTLAMPHLWHWCLLPGGLESGSVVAGCDELAPVAAALRALFGDDYDPLDRNRSVANIGAVVGESGDIGAVVGESGEVGTTDWQRLLASGPSVNPLSDLPPAIAASAAEAGYLHTCVAAVEDDDSGAFLIGFGWDPSLMMAANSLQRIHKAADIAKLVLRQERAKAQLLKSATSDGLTGVANRKRFEQAISEADRRRCSVIFIDVDHFKAVNDDYGHAIGDQVLTTIAARLESARRSADLVARIGGDEFAVIIDSVDPEMSARVGRRIIDAMAQPIGIADGPDTVTVSVGLATSERGGASSAVDAADRAMLQAKREGRGRLVVAE